MTGVEQTNVCSIFSFNTGESAWQFMTQRGSLVYPRPHSQKVSVGALALLGLPGKTVEDTLAVCLESLGGGWCFF